MTETIHEGLLCACWDQWHPILKEILNHYITLVYRWTIFWFLILLKIFFPNCQFFASVLIKLKPTAWYCFQIRQLYLSKICTQHLVNECWNYWPLDYHTERRGCRHLLKFVIFYWWLWCGFYPEIYIFSTTDSRSSVYNAFFSFFNIDLNILKNCKTLCKSYIFI